MIFELSERKNKKYKVWHNNKWIHFGDKRYEHYKTSDRIPQELHIYPEHHDKRRRELYRKRASEIRNKYHELTYIKEDSPNYYSYFYLW